MLKRSVFLALSALFYSSCAFSQLFDGRTGQETSLENLLSRVQAGHIVILGENHGLASHKEQHLEILRGLRAKGLKVSVGMEFVNYTDQTYLDQYRAGALTEDQFLAAIKWGGYSFDFYREQILFPALAFNETTVGLNISRQITSKISRQGLESLDEAEQALLPPAFTLGRESYKTRFMLAAGHHCKSPLNCFTAQSAWDDTMAWQTAEFMQAHPDHVLVIVVGEFHVQYGGGLPDRIRARLADARLVTVSQVNGEGMLDEEKQEQIEPSLTEGPRADFIWISQ
ncbi:ChaN family lipoprotein [Pseudobdellovibrio exovorus]|uniref:Iron-regulated protein n=1 Tax=Pseudobdellovibrio exovorus JSS TaxID=1184267 RepID=M4V9T4_9BACT|nr:ChaN family lipoprotein [Pseudobdellovibrio exovorus]AGH95215.1 iron-regulated protein [Pseudobdellovibrio exovorus JSS]